MARYQASAEPHDIWWGRAVGQKLLKAGVWHPDLQVWELSVWDIFNWQSLARTDGSSDLEKSYIGSTKGSEMITGYNFNESHLKNLNSSFRH